MDVAGGIDCDRPSGIVEIDFPKERAKHKCRSIGVEFDYE